MNRNEILRQYLANQAPEDAAKNAHLLEDDTPPQASKPYWMMHGVNGELALFGLRLDGEQTDSWNTYYSGVHYRERKKEADRVHELVVNALRGCSEQFASQVDIRVSVYRGTLHRFDSDNIFVKPYIDGLVRGGLLIDDDYRHVRWVSTCIFIDKADPRTIIEVIAI